MFRFADPNYLYLLLFIPLLLVLYIYSNKQRKERIKRYGDLDLLQELMPNVSPHRMHLKFWLVLSALFLMIIILARPQFGTSTQKVKTKGIEIVMALDVSNSMMATDIVPSRLEKAKNTIAKLVDGFENDKVGLVVFAGDAFTQLPITSDFISAKMFLENISTSLIRKQGTALGKALQVAMRSFTGREKVQRAIVLITDGENHESGALAAAKEAAERGIRVYVIGVGSSKGSPIPITKGGTDYMKDKDGNVVITQLNEGMCQELAKEGKGSYIRLDNTNRAQQFLEKELSKLSKSDNETVVYASYNEQFIFITWMVLLLLIIDTLLLERSNPLFKNLKIFQ